ncbi:MAG: hypothetical protein Edafosvirus3_6 [Edafosvirus sp.]|uniref:Polymerase nucleotidyl transferase domain-containing protein n=1 Tax=Edafosvirus sp. TaxID=2487765 RepID=A0A3G4ZSR1_9VIRU|nr:MAG: hypothetical protein Edafosvirus3_6 [Edafosvirus sp.]
MALIEELQKKIGEDKQILNIYGYGSINYGTFHEKSDRDYVIIVDMKESYMEINDEKISMQIYNQEEFMKRLNDQEIQIIEALHKPIHEKLEIKLTVDKIKLRNSISKRVDHSYVKAKQKLTKEKDFYRAKKSLFHAFRILDFAIQLCKYDEIKEWVHLKPLYDKIMTELPEKKDSWSVWEETFKKQFNALKSEFRKVAPKN